MNRETANGLLLVLLFGRMFSFRLGSWSVCSASVVVLWENGRIVQHVMKLWAEKKNARGEKNNSPEGAREHAREESRDVREHARLDRSAQGHVWGGMKKRCARDKPICTRACVKNKTKCTRKCIWTWKRGIKPICVRIGGQGALYARYTLEHVWVEKQYVQEKPDVHKNTQDGKTICTRKCAAQEKPDACTSTGWRPWVLLIN